MLELVIKNKRSTDFNHKLIKASIKKINLDINKVSKIIITDKIINFVTIKKRG